MTVETLSIVTLNDIREAQSRLRGVAVRTQSDSDRISTSRGHPTTPRQLYLKPENLQPIGSFKLRGAYNKVASLRKKNAAAESLLTPAAIMPRAWPTRRERWG